MKYLKIILPIFALVLASTVMAAWNDAPAGCSGPGPGCPNAAEPLNVGTTGNPNNVTQEGNNKYAFFQPITIANKLLDFFGLPGTSGQVLTSTGNGVQWLNPGAVPNPGPGGGDTFWGGSLTSSIFNLNSGLVGIGTQTPNSKLTVAGGDVNVTSAGRGVISTVSGDSNWANLVLRHGSSGNMVLTPATAGGVQRDVIVNGGALGVGTNPASGAISGVKLDVAGNARVSGNLTTTGRVGVGVTNPSYPLHVSGKILATGEICTTVSGQELCLSTAGTPPQNTPPQNPPQQNPTGEPNRFGGIFARTAFYGCGLGSRGFPNELNGGSCGCPDGFHEAVMSTDILTSTQTIYCWK